MSSTSTYSAHFALIPLLWQCWKQRDGVAVALKQHLAHTGSATKVSVNLEWWMCIKEVGICAS